MKKENKATAKFGGPIPRTTRARAAACYATGGIVPSKATKQQYQNRFLTKQQDQKRVVKTNSKRAALDEVNNTAPVAAGVQNKKRAVLKDVTNVDSSRNCLVAPKVLKNNIKPARKGSMNASKVAPSIAVAMQQPAVDSKAKSDQAFGKTASQSSVECPVVWESNITLQGLYSGKGFHDNPEIGKQSTEVPSQAQKFSKRDKVLHCEKLKSVNPNITDIDSDNKNSQLCSIYAPDIYNNLRVAELMRRAHTNFIETVQRDITQSMRGILIEWLVEVSEEYKLAADTLYLTVHFIDLFLSQNYIERQRLQLLGITCMLIASKYEEICAPRVEEFCFITDNTYTREQVLKMESLVLNYLSFQLSSPTSKSFLRRFLRAAQASYKIRSLELEILSNYLTELTLVEYEFLKFLPSIIAASAVFLARWTLDQSSHPWNATLEHYTKYKASHLKTSVHALQRLQLNTDGCSLNGIRAKYKQDKYKSVAALSSPKLVQTLFQGQNDSLIVATLEC